MPGVSGFMSTYIHPGINASIERYYNTSLRNTLFQTLSLGGYVHTTSDHGLFIYTDAGYRHTYGLGILNEILLGAGYLHTISASRVYIVDSNGEFEEKLTRHYSHLMVSAAVGAGYDFSVRTKHCFKLIIRYQSFLEIPYSSDFPAMIHSAVHIGMQFPLARLKKNLAVH